jgi:glutamate N-acetyltransferase/amino-acid N-acetyltransferase
MTSYSFPVGFRGFGVSCGIKRSGKPDFSLVVCDRDAVAAGVYTQNIVRAASVRWNERITPSDSVRALVINSGNANACTGEQGERDAAQMAAWVAALVKAEPDQALVLSTGVIGTPLPMEKIKSGIQNAFMQLADTSGDVELTARGMLTTDKVTKIDQRHFSVGSRSFNILGMAKGAAMIGPNMATMLAVILTDAPLTPFAAQAALKAAVDVSFNCISVEGHMSTNDTVLLLASGAAATEHPEVTDRRLVAAGECPQPLEDDAFAAFRAALTEVCTELARAIPADGEGASHRITIDVGGCRNRNDARRIARTIADSPLVKAAIHGADPNWGRVVSAAGYAGVQFDPMALRLELNGTLLYERGTPVAFDSSAVSRSIADSPDTSILLTLGEGTASARHWTCDLTAEYVRLNADYHT